MKKLFARQSLIIAFITLFISVSCASQAVAGKVEVINRGAGTSLGTVFAAAEVSENRDTGVITGDTKKYGLIENIPISRVTTGKKPPKQGKQKYEVSKDAAEIAYANAVYEIIRQVKAKGGNAVTEVISNVTRNFDVETRIETVKASVTAEAIRRPQQ